MTCGISNPERKAQLIKRRANGTDDIVLDLLGPESEGSGIILTEEMEGLYHVPITLPRKAWAYQAGSTPSDIPRKDERLPKIKLLTKGRTVAEWEQIETLLWWVLSTKWDVYLRTFDSAGQWRELKVRLLKQPSDQTKQILGTKPFREWECELLAWDPFWYSKPLTHTIKRSDMTLDGSVYVGTVPVQNFADQPSFVEWVSGQITATETWTLPDADSGSVVELPDQVPGREFWVQTYPDKPQLWVRDGSLQWARLRKPFAHWLEESTPNPRDVEVRLSGGSATSELKLWIPQPWDRPFGGQVIAA